MKRFHPLPQRLLLAGLIAVSTSATAALAATNEDEWYDPSDWFDGNNWEYDDTYDYDPYDYSYDDYDYGYDWDYWNDYYDGYDWDAWNDYGVLDDNEYSSDYWQDYDWSSTADSTAQNQGTFYTFTAWIPASEQNQAKSGQQQQQGQKQEAQSQKPGRLTGTITGLKTVNLARASGAQGKFTLAQVKLESGQSVVVNLGRESQLKDVQLKQGAKIRAIGRRGAIQGQPVFVAQRLEVNGKKIDANPAIRLRGEKSQRQTQTAQSGAQAATGGTAAGKQKMSASDEEISGKVASFEKIKDQKGGAERTLIKLTLQNGTTTTVDLGPGASPELIGLDEGDTITVRGRRDQIQGRQVIVAELVQVESMQPAGTSRRSEQGAS